MFLLEREIKTQCEKKDVSNKPGLVDFAGRLTDLFLFLLDGELKL